MLLSEGIKFIRYMADYRLFSASRLEAYRNLTTLANALFKNHGLTLQKSKTAVVTASEFLEQFGGTSESREVANLEEKFKDFLEASGISNRYDEIDYDELEEEQQEIIDSFNLDDLLKGQVDASIKDVQMTKFLLRRLAQLGSYESFEILVENLEKFFGVFPDVIRYFGRLDQLDDTDRHRVGEALLSLIKSSDIGQLEFYRAWILHLFGNGMDWGVSDNLASLYSEAPDAFSRRKLMLALASANQFYWFRQRKENLWELGSWERRAFLAGASCLPKDEHTHWYQSLKTRLDPLELSVTKWAAANPLQGAST